MNKFYSTFFYLLLMILSTGLSSQVVTWSTDQKITFGGSSSNVRPRIISLDADHGIVIWGSTYSQGISYALLNKDVISPIYNIDMKNTKAFIQDWASTEIAGRNQFVYIVYKEDPADLGKIYLMRSTDYGKTFNTQTVVVDDNGFFSRFPGVVIDKDNQPIVSYMRFKTDWTEAHYVSVRSSDFGNTFTTFTNATDLANGTACDCCPVGMAQDGDRVAVLYRNNRNNFRNMTAAISLDNGTTYAYTVELDTANWFLQSCPASGGDGFFDGQFLHTTWMSGRTGLNKVFYSRLNLDTKKVDAFQIMNHTAGRNLQQIDPKMAGNKDTVGMCWTEVSNGNDIFFSYFIGNNSADLSKNTVRLNIDRNGNQDTPDLIFTNGNFYVVWQDANDNTIRFKKGVVNSVTGSIDLNTNPEIKIKNLADGIQISSTTVLDEWKIFNLQGLVISEGWKMQQARISLELSGVYFLKYRINGDNRILKFVY